MIRGDTAAIEIGDDTNLQDLVTVHVDADAPTVVGDRVTVGHRAIVHGCRIGDDCLVGMGAIVLSGAVIGAGSLVGAGALVREGQVVPPGSLALGAPARILGPVSEAHREAIREGSRHYVELSRAYLSRGFARPHPPRASATGTAMPREPMGFESWGRSLAVLAGSPDAIGAHSEVDEQCWRERPGEGRWSALEVLAHLRDADRDVYLPRLETMLRETRPSIPDVDLLGADRIASYAQLSPDAVLGEWRLLRARLVTRLAPLGPEDWSRVGIHSVRGPFPLGEMVRGWVEHDLSHRRQLALALGRTP